MQQMDFHSPGDWPVCRRDWRPSFHVNTHITFAFHTKIPINTNAPEKSSNRNPFAHDFLFGRSARRHRNVKVYPTVISKFWTNLIETFSGKFVFRIFLFHFSSRRRPTNNHRFSTGSRRLVHFLHLKTKHFLLLFFFGIQNRPEEVSLSSSIIWVSFSSLFSDKVGRTFFGRTCSTGSEFSPLFSSPNFSWFSCSLKFRFVPFIFSRKSFRQSFHQFQFSATRSQNKQAKQVFSRH